MSTPLPVLAGVYYARIEASFEGRPSSNVFTLQRPGVPLNDPSDAANAQAVANAISANWHTLTDACLSSTYAASEVSCYPLGSPLRPKMIAPCTATGGLTGAIGPVSTATIIKHEVDRRGRGSQSRSYISPVLFSHITTDGSAIGSTFAGNFTTTFTTFMATAITDIETAVGGVWSYVQLSKGATPRTFSILGSVGEELLSTQRRRAQR